MSPYVLPAAMKFTGLEQAKGKIKSLHKQSLLMTVENTTKNQESYQQNTGSGLISQLQRTKLYTSDYYKLDSPDEISLQIE